MRRPRGSLGADFDASPLRLAANETEPTLKAKLNRLFSFGLRTAPARFGAEDVGALISTRYKANGFQLHTLQGQRLPAS
jgi:hypothetical protein